MHLLSESNPPLHIQLETDYIILHGSIDESAGTTLRGSVSFGCSETTKIKSIVLKLIGKSRVWWSEGLGSSQRHYHEERTLIEYSYNILEPKQKAYQLHACSYKWDFELPLPGDLPSTVQHDLGQVHYYLKAVADRPAFALYNFTAKQAIRITHLVLPSALELNQSVVIINEWPNKVAYNISTPHMVFSPGSQVPIRFDLAPLATGLSVLAIVCAFKECVKVTSREHSMSQERVVKGMADRKMSALHDQWSRTEVLVVPGVSLQCDMTSSLISVSHKLKVVVVLRNIDGHTSELHATMPIVIASVAPEEANELPAYEDAWKSPPYDTCRVPEAQMTRSTPNAATSYQIRACSPQNSSMVSASDDELPWEGADLTLVPSYSTTIRSGRLYSFSGPSLPKYESVVATAAPGVAIQSMQ